MRCPSGRAAKGANPVRLMPSVKLPRPNPPSRIFSVTADFICNNGLKMQLYGSTVIRAIVDRVPENRNEVRFLGKGAATEQIPLLPLAARAENAVCGDAVRDHKVVVRASLQSCRSFAEAYARETAKSRRSISWV